MLICNIRHRSEPSHSEVAVAGQCYSEQTSHAQESITASLLIASTLRTSRAASWYGTARPEGVISARGIYPLASLCTDYPTSICAFTDVGGRCEA